MITTGIAMYQLHLGITDDAFLAMTFNDRGKWMAHDMPSWHYHIQLFQTVWVWSEFIVLLCNKRKRALHDYIAGTVVVNKEYSDTTLELNQRIINEV